MSTPRLELTGERTVPGIPQENYWFRRHEAVYAACVGWLDAPASVLDAGSGEGYGGTLLARLWPGSRVVGIDYDAIATAHARAVYGSATHAYLRGALTSLPFGDNAFGAVVSLQTIEHIWTPGDFVRELVRVVRPGGAVVISTPNRVTFSRGLGRLERPQNLFHCREYDAEELAGEMARWSPSLAVVEVLGLSHGALLASWEESHGSIVEAQLQRPPAEWSEALAATVAGVSATDFTLSPDHLDAALDLVVVARRSG